MNAWYGMWSRYRVRIAVTVSESGNADFKSILALSWFDALKVFVGEHHVCLCAVLTASRVQPLTRCGLSLGPFLV